MISFDGINWVAVLIGIVLSNALGFLWYGPLFGNTWMRMIGKTRDEIESDLSMFVVTIVASALTMVVLALVVGAFGATELVDGLLVGVLVSIGLSATSTFTYTTFEGPPTNVWFLNAVYQLVVHGAMGAVFALMA